MRGAVSSSASAASFGCGGASEFSGSSFSHSQQQRRGRGGGGGASSASLRLCGGSAGSSSRCVNEVPGVNRQQTQGSSNANTNSNNIALPSLGMDADNGLASSVCSWNTTVLNLFPPYSPHSHHYSKANADAAAAAAAAKEKKRRIQRRQQQAQERSLAQLNHKQEDRAVSPSGGVTPADAASSPAGTKNTTAVNSVGDSVGSVNASGVVRSEKVGAGRHLSTAYRQAASERTARSDAVAAEAARVSVAKNALTEDRLRRLEVVRKRRKERDERESATEARRNALLDLQREKYAGVRVPQSSEVSLSSQAGGGGGRVRGAKVTGSPASYLMRTAPPEAERHHDATVATFKTIARRWPVYGAHK